MIQFQENTQTDKRTDGRIDERLFHRALPATAWIKKKKKKKRSAIVSLRVIARPCHPFIYIHISLNVKYDSWVAKDRRFLN